MGIQGWLPAQPDSGRESGCMWKAVIFSAILLRMLMAYFLPRLLPDPQVSLLVPFLPPATTKEGVAEVVTLHTAF